MVKNFINGQLSAEALNEIWKQMDIRSVSGENSNIFAVNHSESESQSDNFIIFNKPTPHSSKKEASEIKVFLICAEEDLEIGKKLYKALQKAGVKPWLDSEDLLPGQNKRLSVNQAFQDCSYFLALLSSDSLLKRSFFQKELKTALDLLDEFPQSEIVMIPVRIDNCKPTDEKFQNLQWVDLFPSYEAGLTQILRVLLPGKINIESGKNPQRRERNNQNECQSYKKVSRRIELPFTIKNKVVDFIESIPNIHDKGGRYSLIYSASLDKQLINLIIFDGPTNQFCQLLVQTLVSYGKLEDGRDALEAVMIAAKENVGHDRRKNCDDIIQELRNSG
ncbi:MAG: toll/interleukin-1 receptor domain-containing protein [Desulfobacteraceae bacterium]|nr:toll/interleukin-1 receptor domain-containing protein [Desulfobacteraceae bacterium]